ncbi:hypothetical protein [Pseudomonas nunensis]|uniref:Inner membrane protein yeeR n=1 Tax=Pseudomonas nunensis TaxID=2961896 RepID=A0ABY5EK17_9PSED|nr:hypothetical protein [Pseudomonas nunensis]KPN89848.1 hypothetical protein AL066_05690 [Pseudomonas nunensis]MCL5224520.1 hypothetical protein [Pseudomonas nunensis]UTO16071.1 hypothetical protein NK667_06905 [Pseudomonas nunensis]
MIQIIAAIFVIIIALALIKKLARLGVLLVQGALGIGLLATAGPPALVGIGLQKILPGRALKLTATLLATLATWGFALAWSVLGTHPDFNALSFDSLKYILPAVLFVVMIQCHRSHREVQAKGVADSFFNDKDIEYYRCFFSALALLAVSAGTIRFFAIFGWSHQTGWYVNVAYWAVAVAVQIYVISHDIARKSLSESIEEALEFEGGLNSRTCITQLTEDCFLDKEEVTIIFQGMVGKRLAENVLQEAEVARTRWLFKSQWYRTRLFALHNVISKTFRHTEGEMVAVVRNCLSFSEKEARDFIHTQLDYGQYFEFSDGRFYVAYLHNNRFQICASCGVAEAGADATIQGEWYCSTTCQETENLCVTIKEKPLPSFLADAATSGFVLMAGGAAWSENHKLFAAGGQGHGFAAERANHRVDRMMGKSASILGDDNAKNGADRVVQGQVMQTKYCSTGARSVGAGFEGQQGMYKYLDSNGNPMQLEVPKDQYPDALKTMANKIKDGKVKGYDNPKDAGKLIRKGHLTYQQARNITKFGTFESITYDISEGVIVGSIAGGISFGVTALVFYINTKDSKAALRVAAVQAGKTFGKTLTIYVVSQQLHRLPMIQQALVRIDVGSLSPTMRDLLGKGMGVGTKNGLNKALRGTLITSVAVIAITTGPDLLKLARGRISQAQFFKNLAVVSSGVAGGAIGSIAGGMLLSPLGPVGAIAGRAAGGVIGGIVASAIANKIGGKLVEEDRVKILKMIEAQLEHLAVVFMLTKDELDNLNANLTVILNQKTLEIIHAAKHQRRAMTNFFLKPVVVSVVRQRPSLSYEAQDVIEACESLVA